MRIEGISKSVRAGVISAILISSASFGLSGCDSDSGPAPGTGRAPVGPLASDKKALEESKAAMLKQQAAPGKHK
jgi:hypothetical protein